MEYRITDVVSLLSEGIKILNMPQISKITYHGEVYAAGLKGI